jgi:D-proline reductase (dithiol) PrdB
MCHQSVGLVHGQLEKAGIPCISTTVVPYVTHYSNVSRSVYIRFPQGAPLGEPHNLEQQRQILGSILEAFEAIEEPGTMVQLPYRWRRVSAEPIDASKSEGYRVTTEGMEQIRARYLELLETCESYAAQLDEVIARAAQDTSLPFAYERLLRRDATRNRQLIEKLESEVGDRITMTSRRSFLIQLACEGKKV